MMIDLADNWTPGSPVVLRDVAERQQISKRYLEQLAMALKHAGLVVVSVGRGGGYGLPRSSDKIPVSDIVKATIGEINVVGCVDYPETCDRAEQCPSRVMWERLNDAIKQTFESVTLAQLCEQSICDHDVIPFSNPVPCARDVRLRLVK